MRALVVVLAILLTAPAASPAPAETLPDSLGAWSAVNEEETFAGDELFLYINGGADIYHEYGFDRVTVRDYSRGDDRVAVEVYAMAGDAFGIFSVLRSDRAEEVELCDGGSLGDYYTRFRCGKRLVVVTAQAQPDGARNTVLELARTLAVGFSGGGTPPALLEMLPRRHRVPQSEAYIAGPLGMRKVSPEAGRLFRGETVAGRYAIPGGGDGTILVVSLADDAAAKDALDGAMKKVGAQSDAVLERSPDGGFDVTFGRGSSLSATSHGRFVVVAVSADGRDAARSLLQLVERRSGPEEGGSR